MTDVFEFSLAFHHEAHEEYEGRTRIARNGITVFALLFFVPFVIIVVT